MWIRRVATNLLREASLIVSICLSNNCGEKNQFRATEMCFKADDYWNLITKVAFRRSSIMEMGQNGREGFGRFDAVK